MNDSKIDKMYFMIEKIYKKEFLMHPSIAAESDEIYKKADVAKVNKKVKKIIEFKDSIKRMRFF
jgi:hypothetical protein